MSIVTLNHQQTNHICYHTCALLSDLLWHPRNSRQTASLASPALWSLALLPACLPLTCSRSGTDPVPSKLLLTDRDSLLVLGLTSFNNRCQDYQELLTSFGFYKPHQSGQRAEGVLLTSDTWSTQKQWTNSKLAFLGKGSGAVYASGAKHKNSTNIYLEEESTTSICSVLLF